MSTESKLRWRDARLAGAVVENGVFVAAGVVLVVAAFLKNISFAHHEHIGIKVLLAFEFGLGLTAIFVSHDLRTRVVLTVFFTILFLAAVFFFVSSVDCECFGKVAINPGWMVLMDGAFACAMGAICIRAKVRNLQRTVSSFYFKTLFFLLIGFVFSLVGPLFSCFFATNNESLRISANQHPQWSEIREFLPVIVINDVESCIEEQDVAIVFVRSSCSKCDSLLKNFSRLSEFVDLRGAKIVVCDLNQSPGLDVEVPSAIKYSGRRISRFFKL